VTTHEEALQVLVAARDAENLHRPHEVIELLQPVHESHLLTGHDQGDAAALLGRAYFNGGDLDRAETLFHEAMTTASSHEQGQAHTLLEQIKHERRARTEAADGVDEGEAGHPLRAADEALHRGDFDTAYEHFHSVYNGHAHGQGPIAQAAVGMAKVLVRRNDLESARQFAEYAVGTGVAKVQADGKSILDLIARENAAIAATADGTSLDEYAKTSKAADDAYERGDYALANQLYVSILGAPNLATDELVRTTVNLALSEEMLGRPSDARAHYEWVVSHGNARAKARAEGRLAKLNAHAAAGMIVDDMSLHGD